MHRWDAPVAQQPRKDEWQRCTVLSAERWVADRRNGWRAGTARAVKNSDNN